jgi:hypothetical protein
MNARHGVGPLVAQHTHRGSPGLKCADDAGRLAFNRHGVLAQQVKRGAMRAAYKGVNGGGVG